MQPAGATNGRGWRAEHDAGVPMQPCSANRPSVLGPAGCTSTLRRPFRGHLGRLEIEGLAGIGGFDLHRRVILSPASGSFSSARRAWPGCGARQRSRAPGSHDCPCPGASKSWPWRGHGRCPCQKARPPSARRQVPWRCVAVARECRVAEAWLRWRAVGPAPCQ